MMRKTKRMLRVLTAAFLVCVLSAVPVMAASTYTSTVGGKNALLVSGKTKTISGATIRKTGDSDGEDADFYGTNAAVLASNQAALTLKKCTVTSNGTHANGVFSYGSGTTLKIYNSTITTKGNNSGGIMTTGGARMYAKNLTVKTSGNSSAPIRSDRGGGTVTVVGGTYRSTGVGSPAIYSTAKITVKDASLRSTKSEAVVIEGGNSVTLKNATVVGNNSVLNGQSQVKCGVMIYQSMSGDASSGKGKFYMNGGTLTSKSGSMFYVTNTTASITLQNAKLVNSGSSYFMKIAAGPWGNSGSNGGNVVLTAKSQTIKGRIGVDASSSLTFKLDSSSVFKGRITGNGTAKVKIASGGKWILTGNSNVKSLSCSSDSIVLNGYTLTVNGTVYQ